MRAPLDLGDLNPAQRQAVTTLDGPLLVLAGAGSGKTRVITYRVAHLLATGVPPQAVCAVSFTNKAADEMRERVERLVGRAAADKITLSTFHALGLSILKAEQAALGFATGFTIYDSADQLGCLRECLRGVQLDDRRFDVKAILFRISRAKSAFVSPEEYAAEAEAGGRRGRSADEADEYDVITAAVYPRYQAAQRAFHALDFDDLIIETVRLLERDARVRERWGRRFQYLMVDEYQDTNRSQLMLLRGLMHGTDNLCVVGDDDQSIYGWRGAVAGNILDFEQQFPGARRITLEENYRSTPTILGAANAVIANNRRRHEKTLFTRRPDTGPIQLVVTDDPEHEARFVSEEIAALCAQRSVRMSDCAILYRSNIQARPFEEALKAQRLDYTMIGGQAFFERKEVRDTIAYLRAAIAPRDEIALRRIVNYPARGVGDASLERVAAHAAERKVPLSTALRLAVADPGIEGVSARAREALRGLCALLDEVRPELERGVDLMGAARILVEKTGLIDDIVSAGPTLTAAQRRIDNVEGFLRALGAWEQRTRASSGGTLRPAALAEYLHRLTLSSADDDDDEGDDGGERDRGKITLVTLHGAKGLEFKVVFLVGLEEDLLPHRRTLAPTASDVVERGSDELDLSEERRLLYVGITRARQRLYLSRCRTRGSRGDARASAPRPRAPSRFLEEVPASLCEVRDAGQSGGTEAEQQAVVDDCRAQLRALMGDLAT